MCAPAEGHDKERSCIIVSMIELKYLPFGMVNLQSSSPDFVSQIHRFSEHPMANCLGVRREHTKVFSLSDNSILTVHLVKTLCVH